MTERDKRLKDLFDIFLMNLLLGIVILNFSPFNLLYRDLFTALFTFVIGSLNIYMSVLLALDYEEENENGGI